MDWTPTPSGAGLPAADRGTPAVLRLLPFVHHPPARVLVTGTGPEARALDARGYRVTATSAAAPGITPAPGPFLEGRAEGFDLVCEAGGYASLPPADRLRYVEAAASALRPGGMLFGGFPAHEGGAGALIALFAPRFDVARLEPSAFGPAAEGWLEAVLVRR